MNHRHTSDAAVADLGPNDEVGTPDSDLTKCACGTIHRTTDSYHDTVCEVKA